MRKTILILLTICWGLQCFAALDANSGESKTDSLQRMINTLSKNDTLRLKAMHELALIEQNTPEGLQLSQQIIKEADRLKVDKYKCLAAYYSIVYYYNRQNEDSVNYFVNILEPIASKEKLWFYYFEALKFRNNLHSYNENFEFAINDALKIREKAKEVNYPGGIISANMGLVTAYLATDRFEEGTAILEEALQQVQESDRTMTEINLLSLLISVSRYTKDYHNLIKHVQNLRLAMDKHIKVNSFSESYNNVYVFIEIHTAYYYLGMNQPQEAYKYLTKAKEMINDKTFAVYIAVYHDALAEYYRNIKDYKKAIEEIDRNLDIMKAFGVTKDHYEQLSQKAAILVLDKRYNEALPLYQDILQAKDSLSHAISNKQMAQIQEIYNVNQLLIEQEQLTNSKQKGILIAIFASLVLLILFILRTYSVRNTLKKSEKKMREAMVLAEEANEIKNRFLSNMSYNIRTPLNNVVGFSQLIAMDPDMDDAQRKEYTTIIQKNSGELMGLVNDVLDLSRLESGMMKFVISDYNVINLCNEAFYMAKNKNKDIINTNIVTDIQELIIETDGNRFSQTLLSMITYPTPSEKTRNITINIKVNNADKRIILRIVNTPLADPEFSTQDIVIRNEINRLFLERFHGTYRIYVNDQEGPTIVVTYPLKVSK